MKNIILPALAAIALLSTAACDHSATSLPPGHYQNSTSSTDANGTNVKRTTTTNVSEDANGNKTAVVDHSTTTDPKGLFNKRTTNTREVESDQ